MCCCQVMLPLLRILSDGTTTNLEMVCQSGSCYKEEAESLLPGVRGGQAAKTQHAAPHWQAHPLHCSWLSTAAPGISSTGVSPAWRHPWRVTRPPGTEAAACTQAWEAVAGCCICRHGCWQGLLTGSCTASGEAPVCWRHRQCHPRCGSLGQLLDPGTGEKLCALLF